MATCASITGPRDSLLAAAQLPYVRHTHVLGIKNATRPVTHRVTGFTPRPGSNTLFSFVGPDHCCGWNSGHFRNESSLASRGGEGPWSLHCSACHVVTGQTAVTHTRRFDPVISASTLTLAAQWPLHGRWGTYTPLNVWYTLSKKFLEELIACLSLLCHGPHRKRKNNRAKHTHRHQDDLINLIFFSKQGR
jgi:hypothetical protein